MGNFSVFGIIVSTFAIVTFFIAIYLLVDFIAKMKRSVVVERRIAQTLTQEFVEEDDDSVELVWKKKSFAEKMFETKNLIKIFSVLMLSTSVLVLGNQFNVTNLALMFVIYLLGMGLITLVVMIIRAKQRKVFIDMLPVAVEFMLRTVVAGKSVNEAFKLVVDTTDGTLKDALQEIVDDTALGIPLERAIVKAGEKTDVSEFRYFCIIVHIHLLTGGNIAELFQTLIVHLRDKKAISNKIKSISSESKSAAGLMASLPIMTLVAITGLKPDYIAPLYNTDTGQTILAVCALSEILGVIVVNKITRIDV